MILGCYLFMICIRLLLVLYIVCWLYSWILNLLCFSMVFRYVSLVGGIVVVNC